jgi:phosphopantothenoylcysteine decarboxylase / phosphopantothenate---cysteine ligase
LDANFIWGYEMTNILEKKNIILGVSGGIAAYKSVELLRLLTKQGADVRVLMTRNACRFVGPLTFEALSGKAVCTHLFEEGQNASIGHIAWAKDAKAVIIAPATANIIAKMAGGIADDALTTFLLAVTAPILICPSMNTDMYQNPAFQRNLCMLEKDGHAILRPDSGELACGVTGPGRLPDPEEILERLITVMCTQDLSGKRILVTAGPTQEPMDPVRYLSNPSSGKMGFAIARAAQQRGAHVILISGPSSLQDPSGVNVIRVQTAAQMASAVFEHFEQVDVVIKSAAVSDYRPRDIAVEKMKKKKNAMVLNLVRNQDILAEIGKRKGDRFLVGFAAETEALDQNATEKLHKKNLDMIVANIVKGEDSAFGSDANRVSLYYRDGTRESLPMMDKESLAHMLLDRIVERI